MGLVSHKRAVGINKDYNLFANRFMAVATMHGKESAIAPLFEKKFKVNCVVPPLNTDSFGTFSGEIERKDSPLDSARKKCELAMKISGFDLAIASEGSFGSHPYIPFVSADDEIVLFIDKKNDLEIWGRAVSTETNLNGAEFNNYEEALKFATKVGFPEHGLILKDQKDGFKTIHKGVNDSKEFESKFEAILDTHKKVWIETDMRANYNPSRMKIINEATLNLIEKLQSHCPSCYFPGYWVKEVKPGLPCSQCSLPTRSTIAHVYGCLNCEHESEVKFPNDKTYEDPMYCDFCNP